MEKIEGLYYLGADCEVEGVLYVDPEHRGGYAIRKGKKHMAQKLLAFYVDGDSPAELKANVEAGLAKLGGTAPAVSGKPAKNAAAEGPKATLQEVKDALTALKDAVDEKNGAEKKLGIKAVKAVLKKWGVTTSTELAEDKYAECIAAAKAAMPEEDEEV